ncbi:unnamed protein product [Gadus morhua 'NCC']
MQAVQGPKPRSEPPPGPQSAAEACSFRHVHLNTTPPASTLHHPYTTPPVGLEVREAVRRLAFSLPLEQRQREAGLLTASVPEGGSEEAGLLSGTEAERRLAFSLTDRAVLASAPSRRKLTYVWLHSCSSTASSL